MGNSSLRTGCARLVAATAAVASLGVPLGAAASTPRASSSRAAALTNEARMLRDGGRLSDACVRFAEARDASPGVDASMELADCYERLGRTLGAWSEFGVAEKLAREQRDPRADAAHARGQALQAKLSCVTVAVSADTAASGAEILLDRQVVPSAAYNLPLVVDTGEHTLGVVPKSGPARTLTVRVDGAGANVTVHAEDARPSLPVAESVPPSPKPAPVVSLSPASPADALYEEGKRLQAAGKLDQACSKFAQSQALEAGVGITLHLGDCYERLGRAASAWIEFTRAEKSAHDLADKRESTAHARALAIEPKVPRLIIAVPPSTSQDAALAQVDGHTVPPSTWNTAMPTDPGDHLVAFQASGGDRRTFPVHLESGSAPVTVQVAEALPPPEPPPATGMPLTADAKPAPVVDPGTTRRWIEIGLLGGAVVAGGAGVALLVVKNDSMSNTRADGRPYVDPVAAAASKIAFGVAGAAAAAAIVLYLTTPRAKDTGLLLSPAPLVGGGGAWLNGRF